MTNFDMLLVFFRIFRPIYLESDDVFLERSRIDEHDARIGLAVRQALALTAKMPREEVASFLHPNSFANQMRTWIDVWDPLCFAYHLEKELEIKFIGRDDIKDFPVFLTSWFFKRTGARSIGEWTYLMVYDWYPSLQL
jgi:hypothetical protein